LRDDQGGLGFRIPVLIVSPYVQPHIEHTQYETASIVKFIEVNFQLSGPLQEPDARAAPLTNAFNFNQTPRPFQPIVSKYSRAFFLHQQPSGLPVDKQ
jgi:phospholipase C